MFNYRSTMLSKLDNLWTQVFSKFTLKAEGHFLQQLLNWTDKKKIGVLALLFVLGSCTCSPAGSTWAGKTFRPRAWHPHPRYPVHGLAMLGLTCNREIVLSPSLNFFVRSESLYQMHDRESISFTDQCVFSRLNHVRVYSLHLWTALFVHFFFVFFAGSEITENAKAQSA